MIVDRADIVIEPELSQFDRDLQRGVDEAMKHMQRSIEQALARMVKDFRDTARDSGKAFDNVDANFSKVTNGAKKAGEDVEQTLRNAGKNAADALNDVNPDFQQTLFEVNSAGEAIERTFDEAAQKIEQEFKNVDIDLDDAARRGAQSMEDLSGEAREMADELNAAGEQAERQLKESLEAVGDKGEKEFDRIEREARDASSKTSSHIRGAAAGIATAFAAVQVGQFLGDAVQQAADLGESVNAIQVVLGEGAASFLAFGEDAADSLGITQAALNDAITPMASLLQNAGIGGEDLSARLQELSTRATDVGSVFNKDVNEVLAAMGAALRGETEPIRAFGVQLNEASITAKAMELGLAGANGEVDQAAKVQAAYALILEQTNFAAGDFANTQDSLPNLMKRVKATFEETAAALGSAMLPALQSISGAMLPVVTELIPVFTILGDAIGGAITALGPALSVVITQLVAMLQLIAPAIEPLAAAFGEILIAVAPLLPVLGQLIGAMLPPLAQIIGVVAQALAPLISLFANFMSQVLVALMPMMPPIVDLFTQLATTLSAGLMQVLQALLPILLQLLQALLPLIPALVQLLAAFIPLLEPILQLAAVVLPLVARALTALVGPLVTLITWLTAVLTTVVNFAVGVITQILNLGVQWQATWGAIRAFFISVWQGMLSVARTVGTAIWSFIVTVFTNVRNFIVTVLTTVRNFFVTIWNGIRSVVTTVLTSVWNFIVTIFNSIRNFIFTVFNAIRGGVTTAVNSVRAVITAGFNAARAAVQAAVNGMRAAGNLLLAGFRAVGSGLQAVANGIVSMFQGMGRGIASAFSGLLNLVKRPVRSLISWINTHVIGNVNKITKLFGLTIPTIKLGFNKGGIVPGGDQTNRDSVMAALTPGEMVVDKETTRKIGGKKGLERLRLMRNGLPTPDELAQGGPDGPSAFGQFDWIGDAAGAVAGAVGSIGDQIGDWLQQGAAFAIRQVFKPLRGAVKGVTPDTWFGDLLAGMFNKMADRIIEWVEGKESEIPEDPAGGKGVGRPLPGGWTFPLPSGSYSIGSPFGPRGGRMHTGQDYPAPRGTPVFAAAAGRVVRAARMATSYGIHAFINHMNGWQTRYAHFAQLFVRTGQQVARGQRIGTVDSTGNSTGNHLHLETRRGGRAVNPRSVGFDDGWNTLQPGFNLAWNGTGRPETLARVDGGNGPIEVKLSDHDIMRLARALAAQAANSGVNVDTVEVKVLGQQLTLGQLMQELALMGVH